MKHSDASDLVHQLLNLTQKFRSNTFEALGNTPASRALTADLIKWVFDDKYNLVIHLTKLCDQLDSGGRMEEQTFYNLMVIAHNLEPTIALVASFMHVTLPEPDIYLMVDFWESEAAT